MIRRACLSKRLRLRHVTATRKDPPIGPVMDRLKIVFVGAALVASSHAFAQGLERTHHISGVNPYTNVSSENSQARYKAQVFYPVDEQRRRIDSLSMR